MPVLSTKRDAEDAGRQQLARPVVLVMAVVPMAKNAGMAARDGARNAATWAAPHINGARAWTAPRIERSGLVIRDTIAPKISESLTATARRVDVPAAGEVPRRRWPRTVVTMAVLVAVGAAAATVLRRRKDRSTGEAAGEAADPGLRPAQDGQPSGDMGGTGAQADISGQSPAT